MNGGQFLFRPSAHLQSLFWKAYLSYKRHPRASLYEQGHLNTVFLLQCQVRFTLTHRGAGWFVLSTWRQPGKAIFDMPPSPQMERLERYDDGRSSSSWSICVTVSNQNLELHCYGRIWEMYGSPTGVCRPHFISKN